MPQTPEQTIQATFLPGLEASVSTKLLCFALVMLIARAFAIYLIYLCFGDCHFIYLFKLNLN